MSDPSEPKTTAPFSPTPYSVWATENPFENELEGRTKHLDNLRLEYIAAGKYNEDTEKKFQESFENVLIKKGILTQSNYQQAQEAIIQYSEVLPSNQKDVQFVADNMGVGMEAMDFEEGEQEKILRYAKAVETGQELPEDLDATEVHEIARQKRQNYITDLYEKDELSAGVYFNKSGQRVFLGGKMDESLSEAELLREGSKFGVVPRDVFSLRESREVQKDKNGLLAYEVDIRERVQAQVEEFVDLKEDFTDLKDEKVRARFEALATALGKDKSWGWADKGWDSTGEVVVSMASNIRESWNWATGDDEEKKYSEDYQRFEGLREEFEDDVEQTRRDLIEDLARKTGASVDILEDVVDDMVVEIAGHGSKTLDSTLIYEEDDDDLSQNVVRRKYRGTFIQPALMLHEEKFRRSLKQNDFSDEEVEIENAKRLASNEILADTRSDILRKEYDEQFATAELEGRQNGLTQAEIVEKFVADEDPNLGLQGLGMSFTQGWSTLYYGAGALFGAEYGKQGLLQNAKAQAHLNQMRQIFGQDAGFFQQASEQVFPMAIDAIITLAAGLLAIPSGGITVGAAAGYFTLKQGATATAKAVLKSTFNSALKQQVRDVAGRSIKESTGAALRRLQASGSFKGLSNRQMIAAYKGYNSKLAKTLGITTPQFGVAALRSGSMTYGAVHKAVADDYTQRYQVNGEWVDGWSEERVKEVAHDTAWGSMISAGTTTGLITAIAGKLGGGKYGGLESAVLTGVSLRTIKKQTDRMVGRVSSDKAFLKYMEDAVSSTFKEAGVGISGQILRGAAGEAGEEFIDEFANSIIQSAWARQDFSLEETFFQALQGAMIGGLMGGASPAIGAAAREFGGDRVTDLNRMADIEAKVESDFRQRLEDNNELKRFEDLEKTAPQTNAEFIKRTRAKYAEERAAKEAEESAEKPEGDDSVEQTEEEIAEEAKRIADDAEANVTQDDQQRIINEENKKKNAKGNASPIVTTSDAITDVTGTDTNPDAANADVTGGNPDVKPALTPQQKFDFSIKDIEARERRYIEAMKVVEELPEALQAERLKEIEALVASGKLVSPETASGLVKQAIDAREKAIADEAKPAKVTKKDLDKLEALIEQGFPVADIGTNLEQLGLDLERTDAKYLLAVEKVIKEKIAERYPTINPKRTDGGVRLPNTLVPSGTVIIDKYGNGVFNNDPAGMVTLLRNNVAIPLTEDQATNPNTNKSFVIEKQGDQYFVTDIMVPVKGGLISAKTPINKIGVHEPDYGPVKTKIRRLTTLKNSIDLEAINDVKVVSPFRAATGKKPVSAKVPELLKDAKNLPALKKIITATGVNLDKDYVDAAAITMSLDLQEQIYNAAKEAGSRSEGTVRNDFRLEGIPIKVDVPTMDGDTSPIVQLVDRAIVFRKINGITVPFYLSTGMAGKPNAGKWVPFFGLGEEKGWFNKGSQADIDNFYGSPLLRQASELLNEQIGDIRETNKLGQIYVSSEVAPLSSMGKLRSTIESNLGIPPLEVYSGPKRRDKNIASVVARIEGSAVTQEQRDAIAIRDIYNSKISKLPDTAQNQADALAIATEEYRNSGLVKEKSISEIIAIANEAESKLRPSVNIDLKSSAIKNAKFFSKVQAERKSQAIRDVASLLEPDTDITKRPDLHDTEKQADRGFNAPKVLTIEPLSVPKISKYTASKIDDVATAIKLDERLRRDVKELLNNEYHGGKKVTNDYSSEQVAVELVYFLASQGGTNKPAAILEQKLSSRNLDVINPTYKLGQDMKNALTLLGVTSPTLQGALDTDTNLYNLIKAELQQLVGKDTLLSYGDVKTFYTQVRDQAHAHRKRAVNDGRSRKQSRRKNLREIAELGLLDDDPESVIDSLEEIAESGHKPLRLLAKTLLKNKELIRSVRFLIEGSPSSYAGVYYVDGLGQRTVIVNVDRTGKRGVADTLIHEYLHVFTHDIFQTPPESRTEAQNEAVANLEELLRIAKPLAEKSGKGNLIYASSNIDEFLTHILTDPEFQSFLNRVIPAKGKPNLLQKAIRALAKLLGIRTSELKSALQDALDLTKRAYAPQPETKAAFASQAADRIHKSQADLHQMAKDMDMANDAAVNEKLEQRAEEIVEFAGAYIPSELNVVVDNASPEIATVDSATGALILNPKRAALYLANQGVSGLDAQRRKHAIGIILNKAVGQAAADTMISDTQYVDITKAMTQSELEAEIKEAYPLDEQQDAFDRLRSEDGKVAATERFNLAKKAIARHTELATTGRTTNQQMAFLQSNPSLIPTFITYMKAFLSKLTYHRTLDDVSLEMRKAVNNTVREIRGLSLNYKPAPSIMHHNPRDPYAVIEKLMEQAVDVNMLEPTAKTDTASLRNRLTEQQDSDAGVSGSQATQPAGQPTPQPATGSQFSKDSKLPNFLDEVQMQEKSIGNWLEILDVPLLEFSKDYEFTNKNKVMKFLYKTFVRSADKRVVNFYVQNKAFVRETKGLVDTLQQKHNRILKKENERLSSITGEADNIPAELIARASGTTEGSQLTRKQEDLVQASYEQDLAKANALPTADEKNAAIDIAEASKKQMTMDFRESNREKQFAQRDKAMDDLLKISPDMYNLVIEMRQLQDQLSKKAIEVFGPTMNPEDLNMAFDFNRGLYLTRSYRMFEDRNFSKQVKESDQYAEVRERAVAYFMKQLQNTEVQKIMEADGLTKAQATIKVQAEATAKNSKMQSNATAMMNDFIDGYSQGQARKKFLTSQREMGQQDLVLQGAGFKDGDPLQKIVETINEKKEIPQEIRELLGEFQEDTGIYNLSYSLNHTASMISNQAFFNKLKALGTGVDPETGKVEGTPWMVSQKEYLKNRDKYPNWEPVLVEGTSDLNPLADMYVPKEVASNLETLFGGKQPDITDPLNEMAEVQGLIMRTVKKMVGLSLVSKTLGSPAFYIRNVIGNMLFFGPMQGYPSHRVMTDFAKDASGLYTKNPDSVFYQVMGNELSFELIELRSRNVYGDELEVSQIQELLTGQTSYDSLQKDVEKAAVAANFLKEAKKKSGAVKIPDEHLEILAKAGVNVTKAGTLPVKAVKAATNSLIKKGGLLASACDGFFKIGLYDFEMQTLIEAAQHDIENGKPNGKYGRLLDDDGNPNNTMKDLAAEIVKDTAQSYSRALPVIKSFTSSNISIALAPYVRFAADVPRVYINGLKRSIEEMGSDNPAIKARGRKRIFGATRTTATAVALGKGTQMLLWGMDDEDEDKAFRAMVPKWMRNASIFLYKDSDGDTWSADLTYLNPFAIVQDPAIRAVESFLRGEGIGTASTKFIGQFLRPYVSEQILTGAILDAIENEDQYGRPIRLAGDDDKIMRSMKYIGEKAFSPRSLMSADAAYDSFLSQEKTASFFDSAVGHLLKSVLPLRFHQQDYTAGVGRYLYNHTDDYRDNDQAFRSKMTQLPVLPPSEVREAYDRWVKTRLYLNNDFKQTVRGFEKLGVSRKDIERLARSRSVSKERLKQNRLGYMVRPTPTKPLREQLEETVNGATRLKNLKAYYTQKYPDEHINIEK